MSSTKASSRWSVYVLRCGDGSLYTGIATDVGRRLTDHLGAKGRGAKYLRGRGPLTLVLERVVGSRSDALRVERRIKRLSKRRKEQFLDHPDRDESLLDPPLRADSLRRRKNPANDKARASRGRPKG